MSAIEASFSQAGQNWDLERLYCDLSQVKQQLGKRQPLTPVEMACLRGLLCGVNPAEIAKILQREPRGLRVDLSRGLYRYVEILTQHSTNHLKDWRDVSDWLAQADYRVKDLTVSTPNSEALIKIVDIVPQQQENLLILDIKVRNIGRQVAFLKQVNVLLHQAWVLQGWVLEEPLVFAPSAPAIRQFLPKIDEDFRVISRAVEPSFDYQFSLPKLPENTQSFLQSVLTKSKGNPPYTEVYNLSQCVAANDVDRFRINLSFPEEKSTLKAANFVSHIYQLQLDIIYNEDNQNLLTPSILFWFEPPSLPRVNRYFFIEDYPDVSPQNHLLEELINRSQNNKRLLIEISKIKGIVSPSLWNLLHR